MNAFKNGFIGFVTLAALSQSHVGLAQTQPATPAKPAALTKAIAVLAPTTGNDVRGVITFTKEAGGIRVQGDITGLTPGKHGFHIHEFGDASSADGTSAGGHFNPTSHQHGAPSDANHHEGDLGNLTADEQGKAHVDIVDPTLSFAGPTSIIGHGVVVHAKEDDLKTQPVGNAGGRVAVGVIGIAKP